MKISHCCPNAYERSLSWKGKPQRSNRHFVWSASERQTYGGADLRRFVVDLHDFFGGRYRNARLKSRQSHHLVGSDITFLYSELEFRVPKKFVVRVGALSDTNLPWITSFDHDFGKQRQFIPNLYRS
jgi:hypothetical protein